ncbi:MAG TPA: Gfo/Idh/MocA family oxidoreductase [Phycisphaerales bacterium]|nr:Gfo/Idh/MocA family oxidoreductase [Phycisphaerales bacterium]HMP37737.1 Gfo/Idh/MocA family oxidoreductase [Phycisphaerales bacterium]
MKSQSRPIPRRTFLASAAALAVAPAALAAARRPALSSINVGVIGCGGRGTGAAMDALNANPATRIVGLADLVPDRLASSRRHLVGEEEFAGRVALADDHCLTGFDAYRRLLDRPEIDAVIIAGPPGFRPAQIEAAVDAGKHVFAEKPVAVDPVGVRRVIAAAEKADREGLCIVAGTQRRHEASYLEAMRRIRGERHAASGPDQSGVGEEGALGRIVSARCYWNQGGLWVHARRPEYTDMEWQCRNWLYFTWLSGDHIVEQHIHNLDVINWALGAVPLRCTGVGGRQVRTGPEYGNIYDHFGLEFEYPGGVSVLSMCRQIDGTPPRVEEVIVGTRGVATLRPGFARIDGAGSSAPDANAGGGSSGEPWRYSGPNPSPYVQEHVALFSAIAEGRRVNEGRRVAESTLTAIMGRTAAYTGQSVTWAQMVASEQDLTPPRLAFGDLPVAEVAMPGRTKVI